MDMDIIIMDIHIMRINNIIDKRIKKILVHLFVCNKSKVND